MLFRRIDCILTGAPAGVSARSNHLTVSPFGPRRSMSLVGHVHATAGHGRDGLNTSRETAAGPETAMLFRRIDYILTGACGDVRLSSL